MNLTKLKEGIVSKLVLLAILTSPGWIGYSVKTVLAVGENSKGIEANTEAIGELANRLVVRFLLRNGFNNNLDRFLAGPESPSRGR